MSIGIDAFVDKLLHNCMASTQRPWFKQWPWTGITTLNEVVLYPHHSFQKVYRTPRIMRLNHNALPILQTQTENRPLTHLKKERLSDRTADFSPTKSIHHLLNGLRVGSAKDCL